MLKALNKSVDVIKKRVDSLPSNTQLMTKIVFTSDTDYHFIYEIIKNGKVIETIETDLTDNEIKTLENKYRTKLDFYLDDLTDDQVRYVVEELKAQIETTENESHKLY